MSNREAEYHGWLLREVLFDNGEPIAHREPAAPTASSARWGESEMSTQPEALRLADLLQDECGVDGYVLDESATELHRLHELALEQQGKIYALEMARSMEQKTAKLKQDALLEALKQIAGYNLPDETAIVEVARAAIRAVEEGK